jgi:site-specific DNA-methyltransferase (cytosine-N4-specific)
LKRTAIYGVNYEQAKSFKNGEWDFHDADTQQHLHALHPYPARFIPQIPQKAIQSYSSPGDVVLDPFCGCGTTLLESVLAKRTAVGVDNNPVAVLVAQAKISKYSSKDLASIDKFVSNYEQTIKTIEPNKLVLPLYENIEYWFAPKALKELGIIKTVIEDLPPKIRTLALAVFSSIIVRVSNQDSDTRYARIQKCYEAGNAFKWFKSKMLDALSRLRSIYNLPRVEGKVYCQDGKNLAMIKDHTVNLIVTSPPYINAYDYHKYHRHRIHWIGGNPYSARDSEIGKHDTFTRPNATPEKYFADMGMCFNEWVRVLKRNGHILIVIGDGIVNKKPVKVAEEFILMMEKLKLKLVNRWIRHLKKNKKSFNQSARIDEEHVILFKK